MRILAQHGFDVYTVREEVLAIAKERELLAPIINSAELVIDTTGMTVYKLREQILTSVIWNLTHNPTVL